MSLLFTVVNETISLLKSPDVSLFRLSSRVFLYSIIVAESPITYGIFSRKCLVIKSYNTYVYMEEVVLNQQMFI